MDAKFYKLYAILSAPFAVIAALLAILVLEPFDSLVATVLVFAIFSLIVLFTLFCLKEWLILKIADWAGTPISILFLSLIISVVFLAVLIFVNYLMYISQFGSPLSVVIFCFWVGFSTFWLTLDLMRGIRGY